MVRQLLPGVALPGLIYFVASRQAPMMVALAAASSVPLVDALSRLSRGRAPTPVSVFFLTFACLSVTLAVVFHSPMFILAKGAALSAGMGLAFAVSALFGRPLTRTLALRLSAEHRQTRADLAERWGHPKVHRVFRMLSLGWGALLILSAAQQLLVAFTMSPGAVMALEGPVRTVITGLGVLASVLYVRRMQQNHPEVRLLPAFARAQA